MLTRKDYEMVADKINSRVTLANDALLGPSERVGALKALSMLAEDLANGFEDGNPRFDRDRFLKACGITN